MGHRQSEIDIAARELIEWARSLDEDEFERLAPGVEATLDALTKAGIIFIGTKGRIEEAMGAINRAEEKRSLEDILAFTTPTKQV
jgi:phosphoglycolate phosphatase-like HAD superfamily hydrolase